MSLEDDVLKQRMARIAEIEALGYRAYGRRFDFTNTIPDLVAQYKDTPAEQLPADAKIRVAGRMMTIRHMGKAGFAHLQQNGERLQIYVKKDAVPERDYSLFKILDIGDIVGVEGYLFRTRTNELSIHVEKIEFLSKTLLSMPEKFHGLEDVETSYRQRYLDLIANPDSRKVFRNAREDDFLSAAAAGSARLYRSGDADDAADLRRRRGASVHRRITTRSISICSCALRRSCT